MAEEQKRRREERVKENGPPTVDIPAKKITPEELAKHTADGDMWVAFHGLVYDVTQWCVLHPGGKTVLKANAGGDGTKMFSPIHGDRNVMILLTQQYSKDVVLIGEYDAPVEEEAPVTVTKEFIDPDEKVYEFEVKGAVDFTEEIEFAYSEIVAATSTGPATTMYISGQMASEENLEKGVKEQTEDALNSLRDKLESAGGAMEDIVKINAYVVDIDASKVGLVAQAVNGAFRSVPSEQRAASTWVGATGLADPKALVEIEAVAVLSAKSKL